MKRFSTTLFLLLAILGTAFSQSSFSLSSSSVWTIVNQNQTDVEAHATIHNLVASTQTFTWQRTVINMTPGCGSQVCDVNQCYIPSVSSKSFNLAANASGILIMHFLNEDSLAGGNAIIHLKITNQAIPSDTATIAYVYTSDLSGTHNQLPVANVKLFPNPTSDFFQLENAEAVSRIRVFSLDSREVADFNAVPGQSYSISTLPVGTYVLALQDEKGQLFQALELVKK